MRTPESDMALTIEIGQTDDFTALLAHVRGGEDVLFADGGTPVARLSAVLPAAPSTTAVPRTRVAGLHRGAVWMADDFDEPLPKSFWLGES